MLSRSLRPRVISQNVFTVTTYLRNNYFLHKCRPIGYSF
uniref:Uncharacterized protein n=1 Tax=Arundo donax TaxID=35708 RepID=A0A0A9BXB0_ARUDO